MAVYLPLTQGPSNTTQSVCFENQLVEFELKSGQGVDLDLWYRTGHNFQLSCLMWCQIDKGPGLDYA